MSNPVGGAGAASLAALRSKMQGLKDDVEKAKDQYEQKCKELEREKAVRQQLETEVANLSRKLRQLEDECDEVQATLQTANEKLVELGKLSDESERSKRALENRQHLDDDRMIVLERIVRDATQAAYQAEQQCNEVAARLQMAEAELEKAEEHADTTEAKAKQLDLDLHMVTTALRSVQLSESKATKKEDTYEGTIHDLTARLKDVESRSFERENLSDKLQKDVDRLEEELVRIKTDNKRLREEMDMAFQEIQNI